MLRSCRIFSFFALAAAIASPALADHSALQYIPADCEIVLLVDFEPLLQDEDFAGVIQQVSAMAEAQGEMPLPLTALTSAAAGVDLAANANVMTMQQPGQEPSIYFALRAKDGAIAEAQATLTESMVPSKREGRDVWSDDEATLTFSDDKSTLFGIQGPNAALNNAVTASSSGKNAGSNQSFRPGAGLVAQPCVHLHAQNMESLLGQVASMGAMMMMQGGGAGPGGEHLAAMQRDMMSLSRIKIIEFTMGLSGDDVITALRITMPTEGDAKSINSFLDNFLKYMAAQDPAKAQAMEKLNLSKDGTSVVMKSSTTQQEVAQAIAGVLMLAAMQGGGGGMGGM
jgi:hypothetical protein